MIEQSKTDQEILGYLSEKDPRLGRVITQVGVPTYSNTHNVFEDLASCILDMRIHYTPTAPAFRYPRLKKLIQGAPITPKVIDEFTPEIHAALKLSHQKEESLKIWSSKWKAEDLGQVNWQELEDDEVLRYLGGIKGVGEWTKQMILLFTLERPDMFPDGDYQLRKAVCEVYELKEDRKLDQSIQEISKMWIPYRSFATRVLWRWREQQKQSKTKKQLSI